MGWTYMSKPESVKDWFRGEYGGENSLWKHEVLDVAIVNMNELYAAVKRTHKESGESCVWAAVFILNFRPSDYHNFGYKDMDESMGPYNTNCHERILDLLTPTDNEESNKWREQCRKRIAARKSLPKVGPGTKFTLSSMDFYITREMRRGWWAIGPGHYKISKQRPRNQLIDGSAVLTSGGN